MFRRAISRPDYAPPFERLIGAFKKRSQMSLLRHRRPAKCLDHAPAHPDPDLPGGRPHPSGFGVKHGANRQKMPNSSRASSLIRSGDQGGVITSLTFALAT